LEINFNSKYFFHQYITPVSSKIASTLFQAAIPPQITADPIKIDPVTEAEPTRAVIPTTSKVPSIYAATPNAVIKALAVSAIEIIPARCYRSQTLVSLRR
jgi:hypothetical protein